MPDIAKTEDVSLSTAENPDAPPRWWIRLYRRVAHVYKTRVRTTTVLLLVLFIAGLILYGYTSQKYGVDDDRDGRDSGTSQVQTDHTER